ncbi:MAG: hypothetical protein EI684_07930 [Candidatus Viridilinea halotolerans]|uniref:Uncharacterized protein n=1 Tax=Candidatus Viridilinea halotolerans TaxID=2491704 RepID=A0A426U2X1_9CHLR|nr:MAG: hypothetical protein EI684_07930 [Candidatus Viridilinea halotolerans]
MSKPQDHVLGELFTVLHAQDRLLKQIVCDLDRAEQMLHSADDLSVPLHDLEQLLATLEADAEAGVLTADDIADFDPDAIPRLYAARYAALERTITQRRRHDWPALVRSSQAYLLANGVDPLTAYDALLTPADLQRLRNEAYDAQLRWDAWDYTLVGVSGLLAALTDVLLVGTPQTSPLTMWIKRYNSNTADDWFGRWARSLEKTCSVPYDAQVAFDGTRIPGMTGRSHRPQSLGHDPVLGFVFGVLDILRGTVSGFSYDHLQGRHSWIVLPSANPTSETNLISAILRHLGHLISDVATPQGLPAPLLSLFQGINAGSIGPKGRNIGQVARWMYLNGYDLRHFLVGGLTPAVIEIVLRAGIMLRHYAEHGEVTFTFDQNAKYRTMLLSAHGIAAMANGGKVALLQGNPLAINLAQWYAFIGYLIPSLHSWLFDAQRLRTEHIQKISAPVWDELLLNSTTLIRHVATQIDTTVTLQ